MSKPKQVKSDCCGKNVEERGLPISIYGSIEKEYVCSRCHKPCTPVEEKENTTNVVENTTEEGE